MKAVSTKIRTGDGGITVNSRLLLADVRAFLLTPGVEGVDYLDAVGLIVMHFDSAATQLRRMDVEEVKRDRFVGCDEPEKKDCDICGHLGSEFVECSECECIECIECSTEVGWEVGACSIEGHDVKAAQRIQREHRTAYALLEGKLDRAAEILQHGLKEGDESEAAAFTLGWLRASAKDALSTLKAAPVDKTRAA